MFPKFVFLDSIEKIKIRYSILFPALLLGLIWLVKFFGEAFGLQPAQFGVAPRTAAGLAGILLSPLIHDPDGYDHILSNSVPLFVLGVAVYYFYRRVAFRVFWAVYLLHGVLVWLLARPLIHIGASGLIYGFTTFLFFSGVLRGDRTSMALALLVTFLYGGMVWGIFPQPDNTSWEAHLAGAVVGAACAVYFRGGAIAHGPIATEDALTPFDGGSPSPTGEGGAAWDDLGYDQVHYDDVVEEGEDGDEDVEEDDKMV